MIDDTLSKIEGTIQNADTLNEGRRRELLELVSKLKSEVGSLSQTHEDQARSIAGFTELSTHEATRTQKNPQLLSHALGGLSSSVKGFEETHPRLVQIVTSVSNFLSGLGI